MCRLNEEKYCLRISGFMLLTNIKDFHPSDTGSKFLSPSFFFSICQVVVGEQSSDLLRGNELWTFDEMDFLSANRPRKAGCLVTFQHIKLSTLHIPGRVMVVGKMVTLVGARQGIIAVLLLEWSLSTEKHRLPIHLYLLIPNVTGVTCNFLLLLWGGKERDA